MRHSPNEISLERTRDAFLSAGGVWTELVERVQRYFPNLRVWPYENYRGNEQAYISLITGAQLTVPRISDPSETARLPAETIEMLEQMRRSGEYLPKAEATPFPRIATRFEMFSDEERRELTNLYERELEVLKQNGVLVMDINSPVS